jgi:hypothetical protein
MMKRIAYQEGQWFAVPLCDGGYAVGILVRGSSRTRGGLGYFFGPRSTNLPDSSDLASYHPEEAILIAWFGGLGLAEGNWPLIESDRTFRRPDWPVPSFKRISPLAPEKGWLVEYDQNDDGVGHVIKETVRDAGELTGLPRDSQFGAGAIEIELTKLLGPQA